MVVSGGMLLVPMWRRGLVQMLMDILVRIITDSGSMAMVAKIVSSHYDDNSGVMAEDNL